MFNSDLKDALGSRVVVHTPAITIRGTLTAVTKGMLRIDAAEAVGEALGPTRIDGHMLIDRTKADYIQVVGS